MQRVFGFFNHHKGPVVMPGAIAILTILTFGGWSSLIIGWVAGLLTTPAIPVTSPQTMARRGIIPGLVLGSGIFLASFIEGLVIRPSSGQSPVGLGNLFIYGLGGLGTAVLATAIKAAIPGLPNPRLANLVTLGFSLMVFPFVDQVAQTGWIATTVQIMIFTILALGLNITVGFAGLLDLGYAAFFAIGAYTTGLLASGHLNLNWDFWVALPLAACVAAIAGVILGTPTLRLRGDYLAIVTLGFGEIIPVVFRNLTAVKINEPISQIIATFTNNPRLTVCLLGCDRPLNLTGGEAGINPIGRPTLPIIGTFSPSNYTPWYFLVLGLVVFSYFAISRLQNSRLGRAWEAIREDELAATAMGVNLVQTKLAAFAMGATFSGFAGAFYAAYVSAIFPTVFDFSVSVIILCMVILGGLGNMTGVVVGSVIIMAADRLYLPQIAQILKGFLNTTVFPSVPNAAIREFLATSIDPLQMRLLLFGLTLVIMMIVRPEGIIRHKE